MLKRVWVIVVMVLLGFVVVAQEKEKPTDVNMSAQPKKETTAEDKTASAADKEKKKEKSKGEKAAEEKEKAEVKKAEEEKAEEEKVEEIVVTATKTEQKARSVSRSISIITREDIERRKPSSVIELLRGIPSLRTIHQGGPGGLSTINIRGAKSSHTVLLLNGMPLIDPGSAGADINTFLGDLLPEDIERIEVLRGPHSTLYGSDAIGGVINIITREGKGKPGVSLLFEGGSHGTLKENLSFYGSLSELPVFHSFDFYVSGTRYQSDGLPRLTDRYENTGFLTNFRLHLTDDLSIGSLVKKMYWHQHFDDFDSATWRPVRDRNAWRNVDMTTWAFDVKHRVASFYDYKVYYSQTDINRFLIDNLNSGESPGFYYWLKDDYRSQTRNFEMQHNFNILDIDTFTIGYEHELQKARVKSTSLGTFGGVSTIDRGMRTNALFIENQIKLWDRVFFTLGYRHDAHSVFGDAYTKNFSGAVIVPFTETKIRGGWGTGFKAPSLYQLYSQYGSPDLGPERSEGMDIGIEQPLWDGRIKLEATYFKNHFKNLIVFDMATWRYNNIARAFSEGWELGVTFEPVDWAYAKFAYTYTRSVNKEAGPNAGKPIIGIPKDMFSLTLGANPVEKLNVVLDLNYVGDNIAVYQSMWSPQRKNESYLKADLTVTYDVNEHLQIFTRGENIFGDDIVEFGIPGPGAWVYGGFRMKF